MELFIFARFHVRADGEDAAAAAIGDVVRPTREETGCLAVHGFRSVRDPRLFYIHSRWAHEAAFELHAGLAHTERFLTRMEALVDQPIEVTRSRMFA